MSLRARITAALQRGEGWIFAHPGAVLIGIFAMTCAFATQVPSLKILTDFNDLLPQKHPYIQTYNRIKENFGGANQVVMAIEAPEGQDIFNDKTLALVHEATQGIDTLPQSLSDSLKVMEQSTLVQEALGEHIFEWFLRNKRTEWRAYKTHVSNFELDRYLPTW